MTSVVAHWTRRAIVLSLAAFCAPGLAEHIGPAELLKRAVSLRYKHEHYDEVIELCDQVAKSPAATREEKLKAYETKVYVLDRRRHYDEAISAMDDMRRSFKGDALACAQAYVWIARFLYRKREYQQSYDAAKGALELAGDDLKIATDALWEMSNAVWASGEIETCEKHLAQLMDEKYLETRHTWDRFSYRRRYGECLIRLKKYDEAKAHFLHCEKVETDQRYLPEWCMWVARALASAEHFEEAAKAYHRVFIDYPHRNDHWYSAQYGIADMLRRQDKLKEAIEAARICLDGAKDKSSIVNSTRFIAERLKQMDENLARANQVINYQRFGPAGEDEEPGTDDDLEDPLAAFDYPSYPDREKALAAARKTAGDDAQASRHRALTYIYTGRPQEALRHFIDAFSRSTGSDFKRIGHDLITIGVRAARGHAVGLEPYVAFINFGPRGPDGKAETDDDLVDPFARLLK